MLYGDLREIKSVLEIDPADMVEDKRLLWWIEQLSSFLEEAIFQRDMSYKVRTKVYSGYGTQKLPLKHRPVYPTVNPFPLLPFTPLTVVVDQFAYYGSAPNAFQQGTGTGQPLVYGQDYALMIDQDDGSSRSGILVRINNYWPRPYARQAGLLTSFQTFDTGSIQVTYSAGWTVDTMPAVVRLAMDQIVAQTRYIFPLGILLGSESYEDRAISALNERKDAMLALVKPMLHAFRNWNFG